MADHPVREAASREAPIREAVGVFGDFASLRAAADDLMNAGFDRAQLSLLARPRTIARRLGHDPAGVRELEDDPAVPFQAYIGSDSRIEAEAALVGIGAYLGAMIAAIVAAAEGLETAGIAGWAIAAALAGGLVGAAFAGRLESGHRRYVKALLAGGGLLLWVRTVNDERERRAVDILRRHGAGDVHLHDLSRHGFRPDTGVSADLAWVDKPFLATLLHR
jgi:hypothetical protein